MIPDVAANGARVMQLTVAAEFDFAPGLE